MYKYSILMYNFNNYELMREPKEVDPECEYVYVTDNPDLKSNVWKVVVATDLMDKPIYERCAYVRYNQFKYCTTDICISIDGSMQINKSLRKLYDEFMKDNYDIGLSIHPERHNLVEEYGAWIYTRGYDRMKAQKAINMMSALGYDFNYKGQYQLGMKICKNTKRNQEINDLTFQLLKALDKDGIERLDQPIYSFVLNYYHNDLKAFPMSQQVFQSEYITWCFHNTNNPIPYNKYNDEDKYMFNQLVKLYRI